MAENNLSEPYEGALIWDSDSNIRSMYVGGEWKEVIHYIWKPLYPVEELRKRVEEINNKYRNDEEACHSLVDHLLLEFINDKRVTELYNDVKKWCG